MVALPVRSVVRGNPPSVDHQIDPVEFVDLLEQIQSSASTNGSLVAFRDSVAGLDTVTATAGQSACVLAADSAGGVYEYDGTSWAKVGPIPAILTESIAAQQVADIAAKFGDVDAAIAAASSSADLAAAWAEGTLPGGAGTKSAKEHALDAEASAAQAALFDGIWFDNVAAVLADTSLTYNGVFPCDVIWQRLPV